MQIFAKRRLISGRKDRRQKRPGTMGHARNEKLDECLGVNVPGASFVPLFIKKKKSPRVFGAYEKYATFS